MKNRKKGLLVIVYEEDSLTTFGHMPLYHARETEYGTEKLIIIIIKDQTSDPRKSPRTIKVR